MSRLVSFAAVIALLAACGGDPSAPTASPVGTYTLSTINGARAPQLIAQSGERRVELLDGVLLFRADGRFTFAGHVRSTQGAQSAVVEQATDGAWELRGRTIAIAPTDPSIVGVGTVQWDGASTITLDDRAASVPVTLVFTR